MADVSNELDLSAIYRDYERHDGRGLSAYHPLLLTRLLVHGYSIGMTSSRAMEKATHDKVAFRYLAADHIPTMTPSPVPPAASMCQNGNRWGTELRGSLDDVLHKVKEQRSKLQ